VVTMRDVARAANVSVATVSKVLNNTGSISDKTRQAVLDSCRRLGYKRTPTANGQQTRTVGLVIPSIDNPFFPLLARSVETTLIESNYNMFLCNSFRNDYLEIEHVRRLYERSVDAIILFSPSARVVEYIESMGDTDTTIICMEEPHGERCADYFIDIDNVQGMADAVNYAVSLKHRRIAYLVGPLARTCNQLRLQVFRETLEALEIPVDEDLILESNFEYDSGFNLAWQLLQHPDPPTLIFAGNDVMAFGVINAIMSLGLHVPEDVSVIGFDDIPQASYFIPALTTIRQPAKEIGRMAARLILNQFKESSIPAAITIPTSLVVRKSTGYCKS
jgi:DNA-binding LacI/PurR family transcriptional regulator